MPSRPQTFRPKGMRSSLAQSQRMADRSRGSACKRGYGARWRKYRAWFLSVNPLCVMCQAQGELTQATDVDHKVPVTGPDDPSFWDSEGHQALCSAHHDSKTASEDGGFGHKRKR